MKRCRNVWRRGARNPAAQARPPVHALGVAIAGCGTGGASAEDPSTGGTVAFTSPVAFADDSFAELATDGEDALWLAVTGYDRNGEFGLRVFRRQAPGWAALPTPPGEVSGDLPIGIVVRGAGEHSTPCLGYSVGPARRPVVVCLAEGGWRRLSLPSPKGEQLFQIGAEDGRLTVLFLQQDGHRARYRLLREDGGRWMPSPVVRAPSAVAQLAIEPPHSRAAGSPVLGITTQGRHSKRYVVQLRDGAWRRLGPAVGDLAAGPMIGGPVVLSDRVLFPVNEADADPWAFSIHAAKVGSARDREAARLSSGAGNAQGRLDLAGGQAWATWQEDDPRRDGRFRASIYAAELGANGRTRRKVKLWRGISIGPGNTQVIEFQGRLLALFMPGAPDGKGLRTALRTLP
jgi:hypothetical protein